MGKLSGGRIADPLDTKVVRRSECERDRAARRNIYVFEGLVGKPERRRACRRSSP